MRVMSWLRVLVGNTSGVLVVTVLATASALSPRKGGPMNRSMSLVSGVLLVLWLRDENAVLRAQEGPPLFQKYCGRVPILTLRGDYPNPATLIPANEDCGNGLDDDADGTVDYADADCTSRLGPQNVLLKLPFDALQTVGAFPAAWYTGTDKTGEQGGELLINTTGPGGRKVSYLRTDGNNVYADVLVRAVTVPGGAGDGSSAAAIRIQGAGAGAQAHMSYYVSVAPGDRVSIRKALSSGESVELAGTTDWESGEDINIASYDNAAPECYLIEFSAVGRELVANVSQVDCLGVLKNLLDPVSNRKLRLTASDADLNEGFVGVRSDNDGGGPAIDDIESRSVDLSVVDYWILNPNDTPRPGAPRIAYFNSYSSSLDGNLDYTTDPITPRDGNVYNRSLAALSDASLAAYLRALGFQVDEFHISSFALGLLTPDDVNASYDLFWLPSSGASADSRSFVRALTIPFVFAEHVDGSQTYAGLWAGTGNLNGNENQVSCEDGTTKSPTAIRVIPADKGGDPDHPIIRGLADENGDIVVHDSAQIDLNSLYPVPGSGPAGLSLSGAGFKDVKAVLDERGWGSGHPETQFGGYPPADGAFALAGTVNPCTGQMFWSTDDDGNLTSADGKGHISIVVADAGAPRNVADPENCPGECVFDSRIVFYWMSDRAFPSATTSALAILRRSALWALGLLDTENRSDIPFLRGDSNADGKLDLSDSVATLNYLFIGGAEPTCLDASDANDDEKVDISDGIYTLTFLFLGGDPIPSPTSLCYQSCGLDFTPPAPAPGTIEPAGSIVSCKAYSQCRG